METLTTKTYSDELKVYTPEETAKESHAKFFRVSEVINFTKVVKQKEEDLLETIFRQLVELTRYDFFKKKLWRKVKGFKDKDEAEVIVAFATIRLRNLGIYTRPRGCSWCSFTNWSYQDVNDYLEEYTPVFEAYSKWFTAQR